MLFVAAEFRVQLQQSVIMAGEVDFGNDLYGVFFGDPSDFGDFPGGVGALLKGGQGIELRGALGGQAPALVVREMPVEAIEAEPPHGPQESLDGVGILEMPGGIQHDAAPDKSRGVRKRAGLQEGLVGAKAECQIELLFQGIETIDQSASIPIFHQNPSGGDREAEALRREARAGCKGNLGILVAGDRLHAEELEALAQERHGVGSHGQLRAKGEFPLAKAAFTAAGKSA